MQTTIQSWRKLGFGLFIHVGLYSILGGVHRDRKVLRGYSEQILSHGYLPQRDYERLVDRFTFERFDPDHIVAVAKRAGMRYLVITAKHHDGFCLFDTKSTAYNSINTPYGKDVVRELSEACRRGGLEFGIYFSWIDWNFPHALPISPHNCDAIPPAHQKLNITQLTELLGGYGPIRELWMDMGAPTVEQSAEVYALVKTLQPKCVVNGRIWNDYQDFLTMGDNQIPTLPLNCPWQTPASIYKETWGYRSWQERGDLEDKVAELTETLRSVRAMGGTYLLNIGLKGDGSIVPFEEEVLLGIGKRLREKPLEAEDPRLPSADLPLGTPTFGSVHYRYGGTDYYTYKPIATTLAWKAALEENGTYSLVWEHEPPLEEAVKVQIRLDELLWHATLQAGQRSGILAEELHLRSGTHQLEVSTVGEPMKRTELTCPDLMMTMKEYKQ